MARCINCLHEKLCKYADERVAMAIRVRDTIHECKDFRSKFDFERVVHGEWIDDMKVMYAVGNVEMKALVGYRCSLCGRAELRKEPYCNCGARMDGGSIE